MAASTNSSLDTRITALDDEVAHLRAQLRSLGQTQQCQTTLPPTADQVAQALLQQNDRLIRSLSQKAQTENQLRDRLLLHDIPRTAGEQQRHLRQLEQFTGVTLTEVVQKPVVKDEKDGSSSTSGMVCHREFLLRGTCYQFAFLVRFYVRESDLSVDQLHAELAPELTRPLQPVLNQCLADHDLMGLFRIMARFGRLYQERERTFRQIHTLYHLTSGLSGEKRPKGRTKTSKGGFCLTVSRISDSGLAIYTQGLTLQLTWLLWVSPDYTTHNNITLCPQASSEWTKWDDNHVLDQLPMYFATLLQMMEPLAALQRIVSNLFPTTL
ncbi:hypothetical protein IWQ61_000322 [Dispira simplex]|nr:hypothetical protein IWQ61_000322 [Dispira simplex]